jgi:lysophospholipase L1-like esterase
VPDRIPTYPGPVALFTAAIFALAACTVDAADGRTLSNVRRVVFLGDSITYSGQYIEYVEAYLRTTQRELRPEFLNLGLPSETVSGLSEPGHAGGAFPRPDLHERLDRVLKQTKPDLIVACYGMNDGIYYPYADSRFRLYEAGIRWLRESVLKTHAKFWAVTPPPFDPQPVRASLWPAGKDSYPSGHTFENYDDVLGRYSAWLMSQKAAGWNVIDIHTPLDAYLADRRKSEPNFLFAGDGVHLNDIGHKLIAREILRAWGAPEATLPTIGEATDPASPRGHLLSLIHDRQRILTDAWLTDVGHKRPGMAKGLPLPEAQAKADEIDAQIRTIYR